MSNFDASRASWSDADGSGTVYPKKAPSPRVSSSLANLKPESLVVSSVAQELLTTESTVDPAAFTSAKLPRRGTGRAGMVFTPSTTIPTTDEQVREEVSYMVWDAPWETFEHFAVGETIYLVDPATDRIVWETRVTESVSVPFESADAFRDMIAGRWGKPIFAKTGTDPLPGWGVAWRAEPVRQLDLARPADQDPWLGFMFTSQLDEPTAAALGLAN
ncbi:unannotated protein [freshwater metagenome]|uniref:Unannotated protein n=1 Tax=freshwater metagenome TaxID=449393 RepID=A0A6J6CVH8_9ZZZZ|nr:hypothetical protein [Actinomycetota bacterium]